MADSLIPDLGLRQIPFMGVGIRDTRAVRPREILAANFEKLMKAAKHPNLSSVTEAGGGSNGTLHRIRTGKVQTGVDNLEDLASAYGIEPWQLLLPSLNVHARPMGKVSVSGTPQWPFASIDPGRYEALDGDQKLMVEAAVEKAITEGEAVTAARIARLRLAPEVAEKNPLKARGQG